jgi:hypothetical protein
LARDRGALCAVPAVAAGRFLVSVFASVAAVALAFLRASGRVNSCPATRLAFPAPAAAARVVPVVDRLAPLAPALRARPALDRFCVTRVPTPRFFPRDDLMA